MRATPKKKSFHRIAAVTIAVLTLALLLLTAPDIGLTWDEPAYIAASESYATWYGELFSNPGNALSNEVIDQYWGVNHEHPPFDKIWSAAVWSMGRLVLDDLTAHRLGNMILVAVLAAMLYMLVAENYSGRAGLLAVALLLSMPRFFFHAHLASLDMPAAVMSFAVVFVFWKTKDRPGWGSTVLLGVIWGLAVATKINAVFVMPVLFLWVLIFQREKWLVRRLLFACLIAFPVFVLSWPWLFPDLVERLIAYVRWITVDHWQIGQYYLGEFHMPPPWHFPFVMVVAVLPITILITFFIGAGRTWKEKANQGLGVLLLINALAPLLVLSTGKSMVYDNERLFMPAFIFIAALAAVGTDWILGWLSGALNKAGGRIFGMLLSVVVLLLVFTPHLLPASKLYPHLLSFYSKTVGGLQGATEIGLETTYWCETYAETLDYLNENAKPGDKVWVEPWSHDVMVYFQLQGDLRDDLLISIPQWGSSVLGGDRFLVEFDYKEADFIVFQHRETYTSSQDTPNPLASWLKEREPEFSWSYSGIPLIEVFSNP